MEYVFEIKPKSSRLPLTFGQLVRLIDTTPLGDGSLDTPGLVVPFWEW